MRTDSSQRIRIPGALYLSIVIALALLVTLSSAVAQRTIFLGAAEPVTVLGDSNSGADLTTISSAVKLAGSFQTIAVNNSAGLLISGNESGNTGVTKTGTGAGVVNAGTLAAEATGSLGATSSITINGGGTLFLSQPREATTDRINNTSTMTLNDGAFATSGQSEFALTGATVTAGIGALTLSGGSIADLGSGWSVPALANSSLQTWTGVASIYNGTGTPIRGGGIHQLYIGSDSTGLNAEQLSQIVFYSDSGITALGTGGYMLSMEGELAPVPEPATWATASLTVVYLCFAQRRRLRKLIGRITRS